MTSLVQKLSVPVRALRLNLAGIFAVDNTEVQKLSMPVRALRPFQFDTNEVHSIVRVQKLSMPVRALRLQ